MTKKDQAALAFIKGYIQDKGFAPNFAEIMEAVGERSKAGISRSLERLESHQLIARNAGVARSIRVLQSHD